MISMIHPLFLTGVWQHSVSKINGTSTGFSRNADEIRGRTWTDVPLLKHCTATFKIRNIHICSRWFKQRKNQKSCKLPQLAAASSRRNMYLCWSHLEHVRKTGMPSHVSASPKAQLLRNSGSHNLPIKVFYRTTPPRKFALIMPRKKRVPCTEDVKDH